MIKISDVKIGSWFQDGEFIEEINKRGNVKYHCSSADSFLKYKDKYNELCEELKAALKSFIRSMNSKYGKMNHEYRIS